MIVLEDIAEGIKLLELDCFVGGVDMASELQDSLKTLRFECRPVKWLQKFAPTTRAVHEHALKVYACHDSANTDAHNMGAMLETGMRDRLTFLQ